MEELELTNAEMATIAGSDTIKWTTGDEGKKVFSAALRWDFFRFMKVFSPSLQDLVKVREELCERLADRYEKDVIRQEEGKEPVVLHKAGDVIMAMGEGGAHTYSVREHGKELQEEMKTLDERKVVFPGIERIKIPRKVVEDHLTVSDMMILSIFCDLEAPKGKEAVPE